MLKMFIKNSNLLQLDFFSQDFLNLRAPAPFTVIFLIIGEVPLDFLSLRALDSVNSQIFSVDAQRLVSSVQLVEFNTVPLTLNGFSSHG